VNRAAVVVAVMSAALGAALLLLYKQRFEREVSGGSKVGVVMAKEDIPLGAELSENQVALRLLPESYLEERHILADDVPRILGVRVSRELRANDSILWSDLAVASAHNRTLATILNPGMRAVAVPADQRSTFGGLLRPGDRVDALMTLERQESGEGVTIPLLQSLLVLATGDDVGGSHLERREGRGDLRTTVTIEATPQQAQVLTHAMSRGSISLALRNPDDVTLLESLPETTLADIIVPERRESLQRRRPARKKPEPARHEVEALR
jgi:pilus assembly protein CpaB